MRHLFAIPILLLCALALAAGADAVPATDAVQRAIETAGAIADAVEYARNHPVVASLAGTWAVHNEAAPFVKRWKHSGTLDLAWEIGKAILGVLAKRRARP